MPEKGHLARFSSPGDPLAGRTPRNIGLFGRASRLPAIAHDRLAEPAVQRQHAPLRAVVQLLLDLRGRVNARLGESIFTIGGQKVPLGRLVDVR
jgi:hypothetical protein